MCLVSPRRVREKSVIGYKVVITNHDMSEYFGAFTKIPIKSGKAPILSRNTDIRCAIYDEVSVGRYHAFISRERALRLAAFWNRYGERHIAIKVRLSKELLQDYDTYAGRHMEILGRIE